MSLLEAYQAQCAAQVKQPGPDWLRDVRESGANTLAQVGFPTRKNEAWRYTPLTKFTAQVFNPVAMDDASLPLPAEAMQATQSSLPSELTEAVVLTVIDGQFSTAPQDLPKGVTFCHLAQAVKTHANLLKPLLSAAPEEGFAALNQALMHNGWFLQVEKNCQLERPLVIQIINTGQQKNIATHLRNVVVLEPSASAEVIVQYQGLAADEVPYLNNVITQVQLAANAQFNHYTVQQDSASAIHIARMLVEQAADSCFNAYSLAVGGELVRSDVHTKLQGAGAHVGLYGLFTPQAKQVIDHHTNIEHIAPNCTSYAQYKGIAQAAGRGVFNGKVHVHPDAQKTDSAQYSQNLLLSSHAEIDTKPELEIYADDVKCAHGATVGQLDEQALFYLQARGIDKCSAQQLLQFAFAQDVLDKFAREAVRTWVSALAKQHLSPNPTALAGESSQ